MGKIPNDLTIEDARTFFEEKRDEVIATACDAGECPIVRFMLWKHPEWTKAEVIAGGTCFAAIDDSSDDWKGYRYLQLEDKQWVRDFVWRMDLGKKRSVTGAECLRVLEEVISYG